jgi:hypothetical protein
VWEKTNDWIRQRSALLLGILLSVMRPMIWIGPSAPFPGHKGTIRPRLPWATLPIHPPRANFPPI